MERSPTDIEQLIQAVTDLEATLREELIALQYEVIGSREALSEELAAHADSIKRLIRLNRHG